MLIDTDVLIWYIRGNKNAQDVIMENIPFTISAVSYMELLQGMRNARELKLLKKYLKKWSVNIVQINENISIRAINFVENYYLSHSMNLQDALIAATAIELDETLATGNYRHFSYLPKIDVNKFFP